MAANRSFITTIAVAVALATTLSLSGCFANPLEQLASSGAEKLVEKATGGKLESSTGKLPKDFPNDIPLISTKIVHSLSMKTDEGSVWTVRVAAKGNLDDLAESVQKKFDDAGWKQQMWSDMGSMRSGVYADESRNLTITVSVIDSDGAQGPTVQYGVLHSTKK